MFFFHKDLPALCMLLIVANFIATLPPVTFCRHQCTIHILRLFSISIITSHQTMSGSAIRGDIASHFAIPFAPKLFQYLMFCSFGPPAELNWCSHRIPYVSPNCNGHKFKYVSWLLFDLFSSDGENRENMHSMNLHAECVSVSMSWWWVFSSPVFGDAVIGRIDGSSSISKPTKPKSALFRAI